MAPTDPYEDPEPIMSHPVMHSGVPNLPLRSTAALSPLSTKSPQQSSGVSISSNKHKCVKLDGATWLGADNDDDRHDAGEEDGASWLGADNDNDEEAAQSPLERCPPLEPERKAVRYGPHPLDSAEKVWMEADHAKGEAAPTYLWTKANANLTVVEEAEGHEKSKHGILHHKDHQEHREKNLRRGSSFKERIQKLFSPM